MTLTTRWTVLTVALLFGALPLAAAPDEANAAHDFIMARLAANDGEFDRALQLIDRVVRKDPDDPIVLFERASILVDAQKFSRGEAELRRITQKYPEFYDANRLLGRLLLDRSGGNAGRVEDALGYLRAAYRIFPDDLATGLTVAQILIATERFDEAASILSTVVERAPDNRTANFTYAQVLTRLGRVEQSQVYFERAAAADPTFAPAIFPLIDLYQQAREWLKAAELLQPLVEQDPLNHDLQRQQAFFYLRARQPERAKRILEVLVAADSRDERSRFFLAEALAELEQYEEAETVFRGLLEHDPYNVDLLLSLGLTQMARRDFDGAQGTFEALLAVEAASEPVRRVARTQLAAIEHNRRNYARSLDEARAVVLESERLNQQALNIALDIYRRQDRWNEAVELLDGMIATHGEDSFLFARKLEFLVYAGRDDEADEVVRKLEESEDGKLTVAEVLAQAKQYPEAIAALQNLDEETRQRVPVLFQLGAVLERAGRTDESEETFRKVLAIDADHGPTLNYLGYMWADRGENLERAEAMLEKAVALEPRNGAYLDSLGWVYFRLGKLDLAKKYLEEAAQVVPDDPTIQEHLGDLYARMGREDEALGHYRTALGLEPEPKEEEALKVKIARLEREP